MDLSPERRALLERALADPASITPAEKNEILHLPPPDVEKELLQSTFQLSSRDALVAKALPNDGADLSNEEARWLQKLGLENPFEKIDMDESSRRLRQRLQRPEADKVLIANAKAAVMTPDENRARIQAGRQSDRLYKERRRVRDEHRAEIRELEKLPRAKWVQKVVDASLPRWGFVILRTAYGDMDGNDSPCSDAAWEKFQAYFNAACTDAMFWWKGGRELLEIHESVWVSEPEILDAADTATMRARVRAMREAGEIPDGVRHDVFLVVDKDVFCNEEFQKNIQRAPSPSHPKSTIRLRAVDPDHDPSAQPVPTEGPYAGFDGEISVPLHKVFDWLYYTFFAGSESWQLRYNQIKAEGKAEQRTIPFTSTLIQWGHKYVMPYPRYDL